MEYSKPICQFCKHFRPLAGGCDAFPDGSIPDVIIRSNKHSKPLKQQKNKIVFEPIETKKAPY